MFKNRFSGVLLHITSLNGPFAIGTMGQQAFDFVEKLKRMGFHAWQILPVGFVDFFGSPYCSLSAFAGNPALIDPEWLLKRDIITKDECDSNIYHESEYRSDFDFALKRRTETLKKAFLRLDENQKQEISDFIKNNDWVFPFCYYMALKEHFDEKPWWQFDDEFKKFETAILKASDFHDEILFFAFCQMLFFEEFSELKSFANENGISIIGDMPMYVSMDSADVWANRELFEIDSETLSLKEVAGVPPDYFSKDGQLWGNPLYAWDEMEKTGYSWWIKRLEHQFELFDIVRIDHFRAFASFWAVNANAETAKDGRWVDGPGMKLFDAINSALGEKDIIAEDLGVFGEDVTKLLDDTGFPGMRVIQFGFDPWGDSTNLPHNYPKNSVAYVGTHDNNTILGWLFEASEAERDFALRYCSFSGSDWGQGGEKSPSCRAVIEAVFRSHSALCVVSAQDMLGFGRDARMNTPGTSDDNWTFRLSDQTVKKFDEEYFLEINNLYRRNNSNF